MASIRTTILLAIALLVACFGLAAYLGPEYLGWRGSRSRGDILNVVLGDSRRLFANQFFVKADEYYHSGYYPSMFDNRSAFQTAHIAADTGAVNSKNEGDEHGFLGPPRNWLDAFGRHFFPNRHTHLDEDSPDDLSGSEKVGEILPWLKLSADLDPDNVQTYTVTAYWLWSRMRNVAEANAVLHEGLRNCPRSYEILYEIGRLYQESYHDREGARNVWEQGVRYWLQLDPSITGGNRPIRELVADWITRPTNLAPAQSDDKLSMEQLSTHLAQLEENAGNLPRAIEWLEAAKKVSLTPEPLQDRINLLNSKLGQELNPLLKPLF